jgi:hypothetical protein
MLELRVKELERQATKKEAAKVTKEAAKEAAEKEVAEKEDNDEEEDQSWRSSGSSDDGSPIKLARVKRWFKCPICFNHLYRHKNSLFFHIKFMMKDEFSTPDMVEQHRQLNRLIEAAIGDP